MTEQELRSLVRDAIARHMEGSPGAAPAAPVHPRTLAPAHHASHFLFMVPTGSDGDGPCVIEPAVPCNHCGYCRSYGH
jgi:hypothetical protein